MDPLVGLAFALLVVGVVGSVLPLVPGPVFSLGGVGVYWWHTDFTEPTLLVAGTLIGLGLVAVGADLIGSLVGGRAGDVPTVTALVAGLVGLVLAPLGPVGVVLGVGGTVALLEFRDGATPSQALRGAAFTTLGLLGSVIIQTLLTGTMLLTMLAVVFW